MNLKSRKNYPGQVVFAFLALLLMLGGFGCDTVIDTNPEGANIPPSTSLANIPQDQDTLFALVTVHWDGGDEDGFVDHYEYRYITIDLQTGDSTKTEWTQTTETSKTISFNSPNEINKQIFQVRAVDNKNAKDTSMAEKVFYTNQTSPPEVEVARPAQGDSLFYQESENYWYRGVELRFSGSDEDGSIVEYGWAVNDGDWHWTQDTSLYIGPQYLQGEGEHIIRLTARDDTRLLSSSPDTVSITLVKPTFEKDVLIVDETLESEFPSSVQADDQDVDQFYADIFGVQDSWDYQERGMPPIEVLRQYKMVIWHADNNFSSSANAHKLRQHTDLISQYMNIGGDFIMSGWRILKSFRPEQDFPQTFEEGSFVADYLHILEADESPVTVPGDMIGGTGRNDFSSFAVDSTKLNTFPYFGKLSQVNTVTEKAGFTDDTHGYEGPVDSQAPEFRQQTIGLRYHGTSFNAVVLGFPIYFIEKDDAQQIANEMLESLGYK